MPLEFELRRNRYEALAEMVLHLNKHNATRRLQLGQAVPLLNGSINRGHYRLFKEDKRTVGFAAWALTSQTAAHRWAFDDDGSQIGDGKTGEGAIINFLACDTVEMARLARKEARNVFQGLSFICGRRSYRSGDTRAIWIDLK